MPQPSTKKPLVIEEDDEFLHKKEKPNTVKPKAKITVPSLSDVSILDGVFFYFLLYDSYASSYVIVVIYYFIPV